jgi:nascent polypeptide-associated complex subunit alpha
MPKLPKSMQNRQRNIRQLRTQSSAGGTTQSGSDGKMNRKMRRQMAQQGIEGMEEISANRVIIETNEGNLIINSPQCIKLEQNGMEVYQVIGKAENKEGTISVSGDNIAEISSDTTVNPNEKEENVPETVVPLNVQITEQDIQLVMMQANVNHEMAENTLRECNGNLAQAIINLKSRT